jgi:hypothetical protein
MGGSHHKTVLESLEKMLDMYRQRCSTQNAEIEALKQAIGTIPAKRITRPSKSRAAPEYVTSRYIDEMAEELHQALERNDQLEEDISRLQKRLQIEEEWRYAAMEWMESDRRMHKHISKVLCTGTYGEEQRDGPGMYSSYQKCLNKVMEKSRELDKKVSDMLS